MTDWISSGTWQLGELEKQRLQACLELWKGDSILDVGCRDGTLSLTLAQAQPQLRITGVDSDASSIDWANTTAVKMKLDNCTFHTMDILDAPSLGSFSTIYLLETLEHLDPKIVQRAYDTVLGMLKEDGRLVVSTPANSHVSDPDHKSVFYREQFHNRIEYMKWVDGVPFLWLCYYVDKKENPKHLLEEV